MRQIRLGDTGIMIPPLVFGTLPMGPLQSDMSVAGGAAVIRHALERGVTMIDTAELYGTYGHIKAALDGWREPVVIVSKTHAADGATARVHVERALRELGRERIDIVHVHGARTPSPFTDRAEVFGELLKMKQAGMIGHVGLSSHFVNAVSEAARHPEVEVIHPLINRAGMGIQDGTAVEMLDAIGACAAAGKGVYAMKVLAGGNFINEARANLRWALDQYCIHGVAIGMLSTAEVDANVRLFTDGTADDGTWKPLEARRRRLRIMKLFCKGCGACVRTCSSGALVMKDGKPELDEGACILCGYCAAACPEFIIRVV